MLLVLNIILSRFVKLPNHIILILYFKIELIL